MAKLLRIIEALILGIFFGLGPPVFCLLTTVTTAAIVFGTKTLGPWTLWSLVPGVIVDCLFLRRWVRKAYQINSKALAAIYLFYSVVALGMGMGVPIFNFALGISAGVYAARRTHFAKADQQARKQYFKKTTVFCAVVMVLMCCLITLWAIAGQMIGSRFETPFLSFTFTVPVFFAVVFTGGAVVVLLQYWLTRLAASVTNKVQMLKAGPKIAVGIMVLLAIVVIFGLAWIGCQAYRMHRMQAAQAVTSGRATTDVRWETGDGGMTRGALSFRPEVHRRWVEVEESGFERQSHL